MNTLLFFALALLPVAGMAQSAPRARHGRPAPGEPQPVIGRVRLASPVLVFYRPAGPGTAVQQLVLDKNQLPLLRTLSLEELAQRRDVFVDGLGNLALPGTDAQKFRLAGTSLLAGPERKPAGDGRSTYARLKVPSPGELYVVRESAEEYRHFVAAPGQQGYRIDFQTNGLPGIDSVRAVYTLRKVDAAERGAGAGATLR
ncbi:hypothetical protein ACFQ48_18875 [Hymenobacter caeli]|uniref:Uncharacterized protein n=1 Tax=Hymenobacter caeli TaxID=2735894 RepID=A0ABX2FV42_9BACT|nr:hypothetical protein [Hymenobacter caeli]NRT21072.1 hypothetical protein [Hymenobacter caeli]